MEKTVQPPLISLFGPPSIRTPQNTEIQIHARKRVALLAYLIQKRQAVSRIELATLFWPDKPESNGRNNLSGELRQLTSLLPDCFTATYQTIQFTPPADMAVDSWIVEKSVRRRLTWPTLLPLALDYLQQERPEEEVSPMKEVVSWARMGALTS